MKAQTREQKLEDKGLSWPIEIVYEDGTRRIADGKIKSMLDTMVMGWNEYGDRIGWCWLEDAKRAVAADWPVQIAWKANW